YMDQMPEGMPFGNGMGPFGMFGQEFLEQHPELEGLLDELQQGLSDPDFDWEAFLAEHPELGDFLDQIGPNFDWQQWLELLPDFPWFGQFDPFHQDVEPVTPEAESNSAT
ncbi:MAG: hypothetical protein JW910_11530, partial [Anaerolineae bacterium]|nr:hypothetical protein [Anaerolineae bacterium]